MLGAVGCAPEFGPCNKMAVLWVILHLMLVLSDGIASGEEAKDDGENRESRWYTTPAYDYTTWDPLGCYWWDDFQCYDGRCIHRSRVCDGYPDCSSGEDEYSQHCYYAFTTEPAPTTGYQPTSWGWWETTAPGAKDTNASCNFDHGDCGYSKESSGIQWIRHSGSTPSSSTGPSGDHTTGHGYYMYIETSSGGLGDVARLVSPTVYDYDWYCLQFAYHMYGTDINQLRVLVGSNLMWSRSNNGGHSWHLASVDVYIRNNQVVFEGVRGSSYRGDIAIDDVVLNPGSCPWTDSPDTDFTYKPTTAAAPTTWWWTRAWTNLWTTADHTDYYYNFQIRLRGGNGYSYGRVEVYYNGQWGTVCHDGFGWNEANVICHELGFDQVDTYYRNAYYGQGSGPIWMDDLNCYGSESSLQYCPHRGWGSHNCNHGDDVSVSCIASTTTDKPWWWTTMDWWKTEETTVSIPAAWWSWTTDWKWWETTQDPSTTDVEVTTEEPTPSWWEQTTTYWDWWQTTPANIRIRLVNGDGYSYGRVEVYYNGQWGTVCDDNFDWQEARVICRELGFSNYYSYHYEAYFGQGSGPIWMDDLSCSGSESSLGHCSHRGWGNHNCGHNEDVGVICGWHATSPEPYTGRQTDNYWRTEEPTTAPDTWWWTTAWNNWWTPGNTDPSYNDAFTPFDFNFDDSCNSCHGEKFVKQSRYSYGGRPLYVGIILCSSTRYKILMSDRLSGTFRNIADGSGNGEDHCELVGASVDPPSSALDSDFRTCSGTGYHRYSRGQPFNYGAIGDYNGLFFYGRWYECGIPLNLEFNGTGPTEVPTAAPDTWWWTTAWNNWWTTANTDYYYNFQVRLRDGDGYSYGRVEVYYNGQWGTVCNDNFDYREARVICRELGFSDYYNYTRNAYYIYGLGSGPIWMDDLGCSGYESSLQYCPHRGWGSHNCGHYDDVGVHCWQPSTPDYWRTEEPTTAPDTWWWTTAWNNWWATGNTDPYHNFHVRLRGGNGYSYGRVEVYYNGQWGTVCDDNFGSQEARVVCRELGFPDFYDYHHSAYYGQGSGPIWMDDLGCSGYESSLQNCPHRGWGSHDCGHSEDVSVICAFNGTTEEPTTAPNTWWWTTAWNNWWTPAYHTDYYHNFQVRLRDGNGYSYGRVEVYYNGQWGTVCNGGFGWQEARVICRALGFPDYSSYYYSAPYGLGSGPIWMDDLGCSGHESSLQYCPHNGWGNHNCRHYDDVGVRCYVNTTAPAPTWPWTTSYWNLGTGSCYWAGCGVNAGSCWCDTACVSERDCCYDYVDVCGGAYVTDIPTVNPPWHTSQPDLGMTGSCDSDMMTVTFDLWVAPWLDGNLMHFADPTCKAFNNGSHLILATKLSDCGTKRNETDDYVIYTNTVLMYSTNHSVIIRDLQLEVPVTCKLPRKSVVSAQFTADSNAVRYNLEREGQFDIALQFYHSSSFYSAHTGPVGLQLNERAYAQVRLSSDDNLRIRVDSCVATPSRNPADTVIYSVIENNCPKDPTVMTYYTSSPKVERFGFRAFQFATGQNQVYLHCLVQVCDGSDPNSQCTQGCMRRGDREKREATPSNQLRQVSAGPIFLRTPGDDEGVDISAEKKPSTSSNFAQTPALTLAVAAVAGLAVVVLGIAAMAFVYKHRRDKMAFRYQPVDTAETY